MKKAISFAILAAALYAINAPVSKLLLEEIPPTMMAGLLYLGAGTGLSILGFVQKKILKTYSEKSLTKSDFPYILGMILLDIAAPIFLMIGLTKTTAANASLLNNFEIVATSLIALFIFHEAIPKRVWFGIVLITIATILLSVNDARCFFFSTGSLFILLACVCWGFENNCTRKLSAKNPQEIVVIKGFCSGTGALAIAFALGERLPGILSIGAAILLGFFAYGLSIFFYIYAQRTLGAAKTSAYYALAPFIGTGLSIAIFREPIPTLFIIALAVMILGTYFVSTKNFFR